jgi:peptidyl-prolyl cis-trans isomerase C
MSYQKTLMGLALASLFAVFATAHAQDPKPAAPAAAPAAAPVAYKPVSVNGVLIPQARFEVMAKAAQAQGQPNSPELAGMVKENLINQEILVQEAMKKGLDKNAEVATQMEMARQQILGRAMVAEYVKNNPVKDEVLKAEYEKVVGKMGDKEYHTRHILVDKEEDAKNLIAQLKKGGDFAKLAKEKSKDTGSAKNGGDLDWATPDRFVKPFSDAMAALEKGKFSQEPVKSDFGYHIIKLEDSRATQKPGFDQVKEQMRPRMQQQQVETLITELRAKAKIEEK